MLWSDIARIVITGGLLGILVGKIVMNRPFYLQRMLPKSWLPVVKKINFRIFLKKVSVAFIFSSISLVAVYLVGSLMNELGWKLYSESEYLFSKLETASPILFLATILILPVFEEWIFRGILLEEISLRTSSRVLGVLTSALAFGFFHLSNPGTYPAIAIPLTIGGALLGICYLLNGLAGSILSHILYNFLILVM